MILWINRIGGLRVDAEHSLHSTYDPPYDASYRPSDDGTNRASCLVADRRAVGDPARHSLGLREARQRKCHDKTKWYHGVKLHIVSSPSRIVPIGDLLAGIGRFRGRHVCVRRTRV